MIRSKVFPLVYGQYQNHKLVILDGIDQTVSLFFELNLVAEVKVAMELGTGLVRLDKAFLESLRKSSLILPSSFCHSSSASGMNLRRYA